MDGVKRNLGHGSAAGRWKGTHLPGSGWGCYVRDVMANPIFQASAAKQLFQLPTVFTGLSSTPGALTDPTRDLQRFLVTLPAKPSGRQELTVVLNWPSALKK